MLRLSICICVIIQFLSNCPYIYCNEDNDGSFLKKDVDSEIDSDYTGVRLDKSIDENDSAEVENFIDPHSLFYNRISKKVIDDTVVDYRKSLPVKKNKEILLVRKNSEDCNILKVYYKRLVMLLLANANLKTKDDSVEGQLFIKATYDQIVTLKELEIENYSIKEIDLILSKIISKSSYYNYFFHIPSISEIVFSVCNLLKYSVEIVVITTMILAFTILSRIMSFVRPLIIILVILFTVSFYMTWWNLMQEAEIKLAVAQVKYTEMPASCQPHKMNVWDRLKSYIFDNKECEKYVEARMSNPKLGVTPALVLSHMFAVIALHPVALVGETISKFINNATAHLNWLSGPMQIILYLCLPAFFMILVFAFRGGSVNLGLGPLFRFSFATHGNTSLPDTHKRQTIELIREVLAEVPENAPLSITNKTKSVTNSIQEDNISADNLSKAEVSELISNESRKEQICASGDSVQNDLLSEEVSKTSEECIKTVTSDTAKHIGSGDA